MGCDGSGRGPPGGTLGRIGGYDGRCGAGRVETPPGPPPGPPGRARFPVAGGSGAVGRGGTTLSDGLSRDAAGRVGMAGTADVPGALGSSIRSLMLGGTMRPGLGAGFDGAVGAAAAGFAATGRAAAGAGGSSTTGSGAAGSSITGAGSSGCGVAAAAAGAGAGASSGSSAGAGGASSSIGSSTAVAAGAAGFAVFTSRGGASVGAAGLAGSGFLAFAAGFFAPGFATGPSANMSPPGSVMLRSRARRSTNCRATTSSIVLDALFSSMPCARLSSASTSWLLVLRSSATL